MNNIYTINEPIIDLDQKLQTPYQQVTAYSFETSPDIIYNFEELLCESLKYPFSGSGYPLFSSCGCEAKNVPGCGCGKYLRQVTLQPPYL